MSIFISYSHKDKDLVAPIAESIGKVFGQDKVFFDRWSIQPGDSIIEGMNQGLTKCKFFLFFISKNSITSEMVKLEWRNALIKQTKGETALIPVKIDDCQIPSVLLEKLHINLYSYGPDIALRQIIDVISGENTYKPGEFNKPQNVKAYLSGDCRKVKIEFRAEVYVEQHSKYLILLNNEEEDVECSTIGAGFFAKGFGKGINISDGRSANGYYISRNEATSPNFPFKVKLKAKGGNSIQFIMAMRAVSDKRYENVPVLFSS